MAENVLTGLIPDLYAALDKVSRELVGFIPSVSADLSDTPAALGEEIKNPVTPASAASDIVPAMTLTEPPAQTIGNVGVTITKSRSVPFGFVAEDQRGLNNGPGYLNVQAKMIAQAMRTLTNEIEIDCGIAAAEGASRAHGTAATTPFGSDLGDIADLKVILEDNGAPQGDLQLVINTLAGSNLYKLTQLTNVNEAGDSDFLRQGVMGNLDGFSVRKSAGISSKIAGTATGATVTGANAVGATTINLTTAGGGSVVFVKGQFFTIAGDSNKYVVAADVTIGAATTGDVIIAGPGLREATVGAEAVTAGGAFTANVAFDRDAIQLVTRAPAMPEEGDARIDSMMIQDPISGLAFEVSVWAGQRKVRYEIALAWGVNNIKPEHTALLLG